MKLRGLVFELSSISLQVKHINQRVRGKVGEKRYAVQSGYVVELATGKLLNCHDTRDLLNAQSSEIAGLRELLRDILDCYDEALTEFTRERIAAAFGSNSNPSEIPNSSEFLVTEADQREADRAIADGSAKLKLPETGHGITEVSR